MDWGSQGGDTLLELMLSDSLIYFSIVSILDGKAILLVVTMIPLLSEQIKSAMTSDLIDLRSQLMLNI